MSFAAPKARQKKPSLGMQSSDVSLDTDSNGLSAKILSAPGGRGQQVELTSGSSAGARTPLAQRPDVTDVPPVACSPFTLPSPQMLAGPPPDIDMRSASASVVATAAPPPAEALPQARIAAAQARAQGYIEPAAARGEPAPRPAWPLPTRRTAGRTSSRTHARCSAAAGDDASADGGDMSADDNYWAWEGSLADPVSDIPEEPEGVYGHSTLTNSRSMPFPHGDAAAPSNPVGNSSALLRPHVDTSISLPDLSDVSTEGPRYQVEDDIEAPAPPAASIAPLGPPASHAFPSNHQARPVRGGFGTYSHPRAGLASFPLPPLSPPLSPPPSPPPFQRGRVHSGAVPQLAVPQLRQPSVSDHSMPSSSLLFTPRLPSANENEADGSNKVPTPKVSPTAADILAQLPVAAMATGDDSDTTQEARDPPAASAGASSGDTAAHVTDGDDSMHAGPQLILGGLVSAAIGSDSSNCSLRMTSSPNPTDLAINPDIRSATGLPSSTSYPAFHPIGGPTTDLSLPQPSTLLSFDSTDAGGRQQTLDSRVALAAQSQAGDHMPGVWRQIAAAKVQLSDASGSFLQDTLPESVLQDTLQDTLPDSVLDTLPETRRKAAGDSLIEETTAMPVSVAVAAWPPEVPHAPHPSSYTAPLRPPSAHSGLLQSSSMPGAAAMHSPFQPARSFPNLQRVGAAPLHGWAPDNRSIQEIISTTTYQPSVPSSSRSSESNSRMHSSPVNRVTVTRGSPSQPLPPASLQFTPTVRFTPPISTPPPRPVSPKQHTPPHLRTGALQFPGQDGAESSGGGTYTSPGVSGPLPALGGAHRSSPLPPLQPTLSSSVLARRRVSSPGGGINRLPPPPVWLQEAPTNSSYPRLMPQSAPVPQQQHFDCGDLPEELAPSTLLDTWPPKASPAATPGGGASDADDERDSNGSDITDRSDSLDAALAESCVLPWGLPAALQPGQSHAAGPLRSPAEAAGQAWENAGQAWEGSPPETPPPPHSLPLPPIREESTGTEHLEYLYQSDYASTPAASAMHTLMELPSKPTPLPSGAEAGAPPHAAAAPAMEAAENLDVSVSIAAAIPAAGGSSSARGAEQERRLSDDVARTALSASGSISDGDAAVPVSLAPDQPYAALYGTTSSIVLQPRDGPLLSSDGPPASGKGMFRFRKFLDVARVKSAAPASASGPLPSPGGSSGSTMFPSSVRSRTGGPTPRETHTLDPASTGPLGLHSASPLPPSGPSSACGAPFLQESTSAPTIIGLSHFSNAPATSPDMVPWPRATASRLSSDTASSAPLRSQRNTPRLDPPSSFGTTASGYPVLVPVSGGSMYSGPLSHQPRAPASMPSERPSRILHMLQPRPPPPPALARDAAAPSGSDADDEQETAHSIRALPASAAAGAAEDAPGHPGGEASFTSVDTGNSTLLSRLDSAPPPLAQRTLTIGSAALPTIDSDPQEDDPSRQASSAEFVQPGVFRGNPCEPPAPPMVIEESSATTTSTASMAPTAYTALSGGSNPASTGSGPAAGPSSTDEADFSQRTVRSEVSGSTGVTVSSWATSYPRYVFHQSQMHLSARRDLLGRDSADAASASASFISQPMLSPAARSASRRSSLASSEFAVPRSGTAGQRTSPDGDAASAGSPHGRSFNRVPPPLQRRRRSGHKAALPQDSIVSISEESQELFLDARSAFLGDSGVISSASASRNISAVIHESCEMPPLERAPSSLQPVHTAGTMTSDGASAASHACAADSALESRLADVPSIATQPSMDAPGGHAVAGDPHAGPALPVSTISHSLLGISSDGVSTRANSDSGAAADRYRAGAAATRTAGTSDISDGSQDALSPTLSPSGRYIPGKSGRWQRSPNLIDADVEAPEPGLPGHDGLEVFQRRCPGQSLVTGAWQQGHVSWYVDAWDIRDAVIVTHARPVARRTVRPLAAPPRAPPWHAPGPAGASSATGPLVPLARRLSTHPEESGESTALLQSSLGWDDSMNFESMMQMQSLRPDVDALTHSVQLVAQEPLPATWTTLPAGFDLTTGQTAPMLRSVHEAASSDVDVTPGVAWMYQSLPATIHAEISPSATGAQPPRSAEARGGYGAMQPRSDGNNYTSVLRSALLPRSLGWGAPHRRAEPKAATAGRPPRPKTGPSAASGTSSSTSILKKCKRALSRVSGRRPKHSSAEVAPVVGGLGSLPASTMSSAHESLTAVTPASMQGERNGADSDAEVQLMPPMDAMAEDSEGEATAAAATSAACETASRTGRWWRPWRRHK